MICFKLPAKNVLLCIGGLRGLRQFPGLFPDLQAVSFKELEDAGCGHAFLAAQLPLERALVLVLTDRWSGQAQPLWNSGAVEMWAAWLNRKCPRSLPALDASLHQPGAFADANPSVPRLRLSLVSV